MNENLSRVAENLRFTRSFETEFELVQAHLNDVQELVIQFIQTDALVTLDLKHALNAHAEKILPRLVTSPYLCEHLMLISTRTDLNNEERQALRVQILQALVAEVRRFDPGFQHPLQPKWTIGGDTVLDAEIARIAPALHTECGIGLNYQSFVHNTGKPGVGGYDHRTALKHKERIETGKAIVRQVSPSALSMIELFTTSIQFRYNQNRPNVVNSSTHTSIGLIRCDNFHMLHSDMPEIVDMLVHESIHQYLHLYEEQVADFVDVAAIPTALLEERLFPSPWSGNLLDLRSYTHAILVWFGLIHFWSQCLDSGYEHAELSREQARTKLNEALYGFVQTESVLDGFGSAKAFLKPEYVAVIEGLQAALKLKVAV